MTPAAGRRAGACGGPGACAAALLLPGNVLALALLALLWVRPQREVVVYRHVFHTEAGAVWRDPHELGAAELVVGERAALRLAGPGPAPGPAPVAPPVFGPAPPAQLAAEAEAAPESEEATRGASPLAILERANFEVMELYFEGVDDEFGAGLSAEEDHPMLREQSSEDPPEDGAGAYAPGDEFSPVVPSSAAAASAAGAAAASAAAATAAAPPSAAASSDSMALAELPVQVKTSSRGTFMSFRTAQCISSYLCELMRRSQWKMQPRSPALLLLRWFSYAKYSHLKRSIINQVGAGAACIGGGRGVQLRCRQEFARARGCEYNSFGLQPLQFNLHDPGECREFFALAEAEPARLWVKRAGGSATSTSSASPSSVALDAGSALGALGAGAGAGAGAGGASPAALPSAGLELLDGVGSLRALRACKKRLREGLIVQEFVRPGALLFEQRRFSLRSYMLVASTDPLVVFTHEGFVRRGAAPWNESAAFRLGALDALQDEVASFAQLGKALAELGLPADYMTARFKRRVEQAAVWLAHSAALERRRGRFQLFALDWVLDADAEPKLVAASGDPAITGYKGVALTPAIWLTMLDLVQDLHTQPAKLRVPARLSTPFSYAGWDLVYNEAALDAVPPAKFDACASLRRP